MKNRKPNNLNRFVKNTQIQIPPATPLKKKEVMSQISFFYFILS